LFSADKELIGACPQPLPTLEECRRAIDEVRRATDITVGVHIEPLADL
jgi:hypothetical protein